FWLSLVGSFDLYLKAMEVIISIRSHLGGCMNMMLSLESLALQVQLLDNTATLLMACAKDSPPSVTGDMRAAIRAVTKVKRQVFEADRQEAKAGKRSLKRMMSVISGVVPVHGVDDGFDPDILDAKDILLRCDLKGNDPFFNEDWEEEEEEVEGEDEEEDEEEEEEESLAKEAQAGPSPSPAREIRAEGLKTIKDRGRLFWTQMRRRAVQLSSSFTKADNIINSNQSLHELDLYYKANSVQDVSADVFIKAIKVQDSSADVFSKADKVQDFSADADVFSI
ncbi:unnamed protein product, partial [Polarella glacialis]